MSSPTRYRLEQVFVNLLGNAVKFTPQGGRVTVQIAASDTSIDVRVSDTGRGIDPAFLPHVFERFRQADGTIARRAGGLGLGLFIARRLVDAHGGRIRAESEGEGRGSTFIVSLPPANHTPATYGLSDKAAVHADDPHTDLPSLAGLRVMLVDDDADVRDVMSSVLSRLRRCRDMRGLGSRGAAAAHGRSTDQCPALGYRHAG